MDELRSSDRAAGTRLPFRGATSSAGRSGCCAVLRVLVAGGALRGGRGWCWASLGGRVALACGWLARLEVVSGPGTLGWAAFAGWDKFLVFSEDFTVSSAATFHIRGAASQLWHSGWHAQSITQNVRHRVQYPADTPKTASTASSQSCRPLARFSRAKTPS